MPIRDHAHASVDGAETTPSPPGGLLALQIRDFRNLASVDLAPANHLNLIHGANASGKTSLLEAIYVLSRGRSFRSRLFERLVRQGAERYRIFGRVAHAGRTIGAAIERQRSGMRIRLDGQDIQRLAPLTSVLPVQILHPNSHKLLEDGPQFRRRFLDWGVFHVEPRFLEHWQRYQKALRQRNAALRHGQAVSAWETELAESGTALTALRQHYVALLEPLVLEIAGALLDVSGLSLRFSQGWNAEQELGASLAQHRSRDQERGFTSTGPHRADLKIKLEGVSAADRVSRGQQKLLVCALVCAQTALFQRRTGRRPVILVDDLPAELDADRRRRLVAELQRLAAQVFVTAIEPDLVPFEQSCRMFHVEHGDVREVV